MNDDVLDSGLTGEAAVTIVSTQILATLRWIYRTQPVLDYGIDGQVEIKLGEMPSGRLIALQVKGGPSWFAEEVEDGWVFRPKPKHVRYWLSHALPVMVVIVNIDTGIAYWQHATHKTVKSTKKGYKIVIPRRQTVTSAREAWLEIAQDMSTQASERFQENLVCLPPSTRENLKISWDVEPTGTAWLAMFLAEGRSNPELTVETLLAGQPSWLHETGALGWRAVGSYASEHDLSQAAATAFQRAAELDPGQAGSLLAIAGLQLTELDKELAVSLFERARELPGGELRAQIGIILARHPIGSAHPVDVPESLDLSTSEAQQEPAVHAFLAIQAQRQKRLDESIAHFHRALNLKPESSGYMLGLVDSYVKRALDDADFISDLDQALEFAHQVLEQRRRWDGDSTEALIWVLRILALQDNFEEIIRKGAREPHGEARPQEASEKKVARTVLEAAQILDATDVIGDVLACVEDPEYKKRLTLELRSDLSDETEKRLRETELLEADAAQDYETVIASVMRLAFLGVDRISYLEHLVERGITDSGSHTLASSLLTASMDLDRALPVLRSLADVDKVAAQHLVTLLANAGRFEDADYACQRSYDRLRDLDLMVLRFELAAQSGRLDVAEEVGHDLVAEPRVIGLKRARVNRFFAEQASGRKDWQSAERYLRQSLRVISSLNDKWNLVRVQLNQRRDRQAADTIRSYDLNPTEISDANVWFRAMLSQPWDDVLVSMGLALASRFADDRDFSGALISHIVSSTRSVDEDDQEEAGIGTKENDARTQINRDLRKRAFLALEAHADMHGDKSSIRRYDSSPEKFLEHLSRELSSVDRSPIREVIKSVRQGLMPMGMLAFAAGKPYAQIVTERAVGFLPSSASDIDVHTLEMEAALGALETPVVVEASTLHLCASIDRIEQLRGLFADVVLPAVSRDDIVQATVRARGLTASSGFLGWDEKLQKLVFSEISAKERAMLWERAELLDDAARNTDIRTVDSLSLFPRFDSDVRVWSWLAPIELAKRLDIAFWCDDSALRQLAHSFSVPSFGTAALVEAIQSRRIERAASSDRAAVEEAVLEQQQLIREFLAESVVDIPVDLDDLLVQAENDEWAASVAATQLSRGPWWKWRNNPVTDLLKIYEKVSINRPEALPSWQIAALYGAAESWRSNPIGASIVIAAVALVGFDARLNVDEIQLGLARAGEVAVDFNLPNPREFIGPAINILHRMDLVENPEVWIEQVSAQD